MRWLALLWLLFPTFAAAQGAATLVADDLVIVEDRQLVASGNVEVLYDGTRLGASRIIYDRAADRLRIDGPIVITSADGTILTAAQASLDPQLENGILRSARLVLDRQLQLAANQIDRRDGRFSQLYKVAATSCQVCGTRPPLWEIRAQRVIHDEEAQLLYFTNAQFRIRGIPVLYLPRIRLPDPTLGRATGLLIPRIRNNDNLGFGLKLPYFIVLGPSRDLLLTPYLSSETATLEWRYRQAFRNGALTLNGAFSDDNLRPGENRSYLFAEGIFDLGADYTLAFDIEAVSDPAYLLDYSYSDKDRLDSAISLTRVREDDLFVADFTYYQSLRDDEIDASLPPIVANLSYDRRLQFGEGLLRLSASADAIQRYGSAVGDAGRDVARLGFAARYSRDWTLDAGLRIEARAGIDADIYGLSDAPDYDAAVSRVVPSGSLVLRYPLVKRTGAARHVLEPVLALHWSDVAGGDLPNEDSTRPELDRGNLFADQHFPGQDRVEQGLRGALGITWTRAAIAGGSTSLTFGRTFRDAPDPAFTPASSQAGFASDWLIAGQLDLPRGFSLQARSLLSDSLDPSLTNARLNWRTRGLDASAAYIWQAADPAIGRDTVTSEWSLETAVQLTPAWAFSFDTRYDVAQDRPARAAVGVAWQNECVLVELSASRRYTSSTTVEPSTDYGLSVSLSGFSTGRSGAGPRARCSN